MSQVDTPSARRVATRDRLFDAAIVAFAEAGLQGASVEQICSRAGFTRGAFYSNFESKEELFIELLRREFHQRAADLETRASQLRPELQGQCGHMQPARAAYYIAEFLGPSNDAVTWYTLEMEFLLLAMREPRFAPDYHALWDQFYGSITELVAETVWAAGRRFTIPVAHALPVLGSFYEQTLRGAALADHTEAAMRAFTGLGDRIAELLFALTETSEPPGH